MPLPSPHRHGVAVRARRDHGARGVRASRLPTARGRVAARPRAPIGGRSPGERGRGAPMGYVIAAYALVIGALAAYAGLLARERRRHLRADPGGAEDASERNRG